MIRGAYMSSRPPSTMLLNIFQPERWLSFIPVICLWLTRLGKCSGRRSCFLVWWSNIPCLATSGESTVYRRLFWPRKIMQMNITMPNGCQWRLGRNTYRFLTAVIPRKALRGTAWIWFSLRSLEREMRKTKREILGFVWSHFTFRSKAFWGRWTVCCRPSGTTRLSFEVWDQIVLLTINVTSSFIHLAFYHSVCVCV